MFGNILLKIIAGILGIWLATFFVPGVEFTGPWQTLLMAGAFLGLINSFIKPVLKLVTLPLQLITFGLFGIVINMAMIWTVDIFFEELIIKGITPLFWTTLIIWGLGIVMAKR